MAGRPGGLRLRGGQDLGPGLPPLRRGLEDGGMLDTAQDYRGRRKRGRGTYGSCSLPFGLSPWVGGRGGEDLRHRQAQGNPVQVLTGPGGQGASGHGSGHG